MNRLTVALAQSLVAAALFAVKVQAESDYAASCKDGSTYRVRLTAEGRVVVEKQK